MANRLLTESLSEPLNDATTARIDINSDTANLTIDTLIADEPVLASGMLQYFENQGLPTRTLSASNGQATLTLKGGGSEHRWLRLPWEECGGAYEWQIHLNPTISADITAHTGGGNVMLNLTGMALSHLSADSGGGNMDVVLPANAADLDVSVTTGGGNVTITVGNGMHGSNTVDAHSGAGNVAVHVPHGIAARVHATSGLGRVIVDPQFIKVDRDTYQSPDYDAAANRLAITVDSGAGNVSIDTKQTV